MKTLQSDTTSPNIDTSVKKMVKFELEPPSPRHEHEHNINEEQSVITINTL